MKKRVNTVISIIVVLSIGIGIGYATGVSIESKDVVYENSGTTLASSNVQNAIDEIYTKSNGGDATSSQILTGKKAIVGGKTIVGTMANNGAISQTLSPGASYTIPAGYHNGSGKVTASSSGTYGTTKLISSTTNNNITYSSATVGKKYIFIQAVGWSSAGGTKAPGVSVSGCTDASTVLSNQAQINSSMFIYLGVAITTCTATSTTISGSFSSWGGSNYAGFRAMLIEV